MSYTGGLMDARGLPDRITDLPRTESRVDAFTLAAKGCDVLFVRAKAGTELAPHTHDTDNYSVMLDGEVVMTVDGDERRHGIGEWCHVPPGQPHGVRFDVDSVQLELRFHRPDQ
jgi:quercetin dioxygenase-like cupin family protein